MFAKILCVVMFVVIAASAQVKKSNAVKVHRRY